MCVPSHYSPHVLLCLNWPIITVPVSTAPVDICGYPEVSTWGISTAMVVALLVFISCLVTFFAGRRFESFQNCLVYYK